MKRFRFTLQPVLVLRERAERQALEAFARALADQRLQASNLAAADKELAEGHALSRRQLASGAPAALLLQQLAYCSFLQERRKAASRSLALAETMAKKASLAMNIARQQRQVVETFRDKQLAAYDHNCSIEEQKMLDELAGRRLEHALSWKTSDHD